MNDQRIIDLFFLRSEQAIYELDVQYGKVCRSVSFHILKDRLDVEECVNDAYLATWNAIPPQRPDPLLAFVCKIVRNLSITRYRSNTAMKRSSSYDIAISEIEHCIAAPETLESIMDARTLAKSIEGFLDTMTEENRVIFLRRYWFADSYAEIANLTGLTEKNISVRLVHMRNKLRTYLKKEGMLV